MKFVFYLISEWPSTTTPKCKNSSNDIFNIDAEEERLFDERSEEDLLKLIDENSICEVNIHCYYILQAFVTKHIVCSLLSSIIPNRICQNLLPSLGKAFFLLSITTKSLY